MARALRTVLSRAMNLHLRRITMSESEKIPSNIRLSRINPPFRTVVTVGDHTSKWMQKVDQKTPMEFINEVPPLLVEGRVAACVGGPDLALGHPVEYISLDDDKPSVCKYCGLRYEQIHHHHH